MEPEIIYKDSEWVWQALIKQFEAETGLVVASVGNVFGHILGKDFEDFDFQVKRLSVELKGVEIEIEMEDGQ